MKIFAGERLNAIMVRLKMPEGEAIEAGMVTRSLESAQRKVEQRNFDIRKQLLEYDDVSNDQRKVIYQQRNELLATDDISETITAMRQGVIYDTFAPMCRRRASRSNGRSRHSSRRSSRSSSSKVPVGEWIQAEPTLDDDEMVKRIPRRGR